MGKGGGESEWGKLLFGNVLEISLHTQFKSACRGQILGPNMLVEMDVRKDCRTNDVENVGNDAVTRNVGIEQSTFSLKNAHETSEG